MPRPLGYVYDDNGNLVTDGTNAYTWDHANRMWTAPGNTTHRYDGDGNRISQQNGVDLTTYLLDTQRGLTQTLAATTGADTVRYLHGPRGIHAQQTPTAAWEVHLQDGLGSVRALTDTAGAILGTVERTPYGETVSGSVPTQFDYTGEYRDTGTDMLYLRARYYDPATGVFPSLDPFEGTAARPMSLNGYSYVEGRVTNAVDPSGKQMCPTECEMLRAQISDPRILWANGCTFEGSTQCPSNFELRGNECVPVIPVCQTGYSAVYNEYPDSSGFFAGRGYYTCECRFQTSDGSCFITPGGEPPPTACEIVASHITWAMEGVGERGSTIEAIENAVVINLLQLDYDNNIGGFRHAVDACGDELNQHYSRDCQLNSNDWKDLLINTGGVLSANPDVRTATKLTAKAISATDWGITTATTEANIYGYLDTLRNTYGNLTSLGAMLNVFVTMGNSCGWREVE